MNRNATTWVLGVLGWVLGVLGWVVSYAFFAKWLAEHEWDFWGGWVEAFTISDFATGLGVDLVAVSLILIALAIRDRERLGRKWTLAVVAALGLSASMSLAIYLVGIARALPEAPEAAPQG